MEPFRSLVQTYVFFRLMTRLESQKSFTIAIEAQQICQRRLAHINAVHTSALSFGCGRHVSRGSWCCRAERVQDRDAGVSGRDDQDPAGIYVLFDHS